jgi:hypothetical protein
MVALEQYIEQRWNKLSNIAKSLITDYSAKMFVISMWTKQYYMEKIYDKENNE